MNIVISGANRGIGLELAKIYSVDNKVYALCRSSSDNLAALSNTTVIEGVELQSQEKILNAVKILPDSIDILINNAGVYTNVSMPGIDSNGIESINSQFQINALGALLLVDACFDKLRHGAKIALISSRMGSIGDNSSGSAYGYRMSKAALNAAGKSLAIDLKGRGVSVAILHPGWVKTQMTGMSGNYSVDFAASQLIDRINDLNLENTGTFWHGNAQVLPW